jgi:hypothetical protein
MWRSGRHGTSARGDLFVGSGVMSGQISAFMVDFTGDKRIAAIFMHEFVTIV